MEGREINVSKIEAAQRQLDTAIALWFEEGDEISIHTLAGASHQIIHDLNSKAGGPDLIYDSLNFKDEFRRDAVALLKSGINFFKHADRDPDPALQCKFHTSLSELFMLFSIFGLEHMKIERTPAEYCYISWHFVHHPEELTEQGKRIYGDNSPTVDVAAVRRIPKKEFFDTYVLARRLANKRASV
jgi:hypothetical protein